MDDGNGYGYRRGDPGGAWDVALMLARERPKWLMILVALYRELSTPIREQHVWRAPSREQLAGMRTFYSH